MGLFSVRAELVGPRGQPESIDLLVDTGATLLTVPEPLAERLGLVPARSQPVILAGGEVTAWPIAEIRLSVAGQEVPTLCFIAPAGPALLGAVALESLFLAVDPVGKRLVPVDGYVMAV